MKTKRKGFKKFIRNLEGIKGVDDNRVHYNMPEFRDADQLWSNELRVGERNHWVTPLMIWEYTEQGDSFWRLIHNGDDYANWGEAAAIIASWKEQLGYA